MKKFDPKSSVLAGLFCGVSLVVDRLNFLIFLGLLSYAFLLNKRNSLLFFMAFLLGISPLLLYNFLNFGNPFEFAFMYVDKNIFRRAYPESSLTSRFVRASVFDLSFLKKRFHLQEYDPYVTIRLLFYPYRGLFIYSPILLLSFLGIFYMRKEYEIEALLFLYFFF